MSNIVWQTPAPSSGFLHGVEVRLKPRREIVLIFQFEDEEVGLRSCNLVFRDVIHYRTTYMVALRADWILDAYDRVVDVGTSPELLEVVAAMQANGHSAELQHYRTCFDDGPCFDFIAAEFEALISRQITNE